MEQKFNLYISIDIFTCTGLLTLAHGANIEPDIRITLWKWDCLRIKK
jgi:hypothetical protein